METIESYIDQVVDILQKLNGAPAILLVAIFCLVAGYILRFVKSIPNNAIPLIVTLLGGTYALIADGNNDMPLRTWMIRNVLVGLIVGFGTWVFHRVVLKRMEDKIPVLGPMLAALDAPDVPDTTATTTPAPPKP